MEGYLAMSPEAQNMAIAKACGWDGFEDSLSPEFPPIGVPPQNEVTERLLGPQKITNWTPRFPVPDYLKDLNACAEFEKVITDNALGYDYLCELHEAVWGERCWKVSEADHFTCATATAAQRAKSFLRAMDLWVDSPEEKA